MTLTVSSTFAFTGGEGVSSQALNTFHTEFAGATDITWTLSSNFYKVSFTLNEQKLFAYYDRSGEFIAVTRNISSVQLPLNLKRSLGKFMTNCWISDLFEIANHDETSWYVTLETPDSRIVLKSDNGSRWIVYQKMQNI